MEREETIHEKLLKTENQQGKSRGRRRQNLKQAPGSELSAQSLIWGLNSQMVRS